MKSEKKSKPPQALLGILPGRKPLGQHVFENLRQAIVRGDISPGARLVENRVAEAMGISRTPVREAIHKLEREGLLQKLPRGGFTVVNLSWEEIEETIGIRCVLESYAARLAAVNHKEKELASLEKKIKEFQKNLDEGRMDALPRVNTEFHNLLYGLCGSPKLIKMISDLRDQIYRARTIILNVERMAKVSNQDHRRMLSAIRNRDTDKVESLVREHILRGREIVRQELDNQRGRTDLKESLSHRAHRGSEQTAERKA
jgi:DNA-binding GntR family transcriptional regulator